MGSAPGFHASAVIGMLLLACAAAHAEEGAMEFGGRKRWWTEHSARSSAGPLPVVLVLHGGGGDPYNSERMSGMNELADREGFLAVYPAGTGRLSRRLLTWNAGRCCGFAKKKNVDDTGFLSALIDRLVKEGRADPKRVYMTGMSNGAMMSHRFACEAADKVAAIAPVAGALNVETCRPSRPVSVLIIHGRNDQHAPYEGGEGKKSFESRIDRSVPESAKIWADANRCLLDPKGAYACPDGVQVRILDHPGGHIWPGGKPGRRSGNVDPVLPDPKASETMWSFFNPQ